MDTKIQELTEKIYNEGVQKAQAEGDKLIAEAQANAKQIEAEAEQKAEEILRNANKRNAELKQNTESELKLYASQMLESIKTSLLDKLTGEITSSNVQAASVDSAFIQQLVLKIVSGFDLDRGVVIESAQAEELRAYFASNAKHLLERGVEIRSVSGKPTHFVVAPADGAFKVQFGESELQELFKSFLRPQLAEMLF